MDAREDVKIPAILLIVNGALGILFSFGTLAMNLLGAGMGMLSGGGGSGAEQVGQLLSGGIGILGAIIGLATSGFGIFGGMKMMNLQSHGVALAASIMAIIPCTSGCCCLGIPVGIWGLIVLLKPEVKAAFR